MSRGIATLVFLIAILFLMAMCLGSSGGNGGKKVLELGDEVRVPDGFYFVGASAHGRFAKIETLYCQNLKSGQVFTCNDGKVGEEIVFPDGYSFAGASAYGEFTSILTFYCRMKGTERVFVCKPKN